MKWPAFELAVDRHQCRRLGAELNSASLPLGLKAPPGGRANLALGETPHAAGLDPVARFS